MITEMVVYCKTIMLSCEPAQFCMLFYTQPQVDKGKTFSFLRKS